MDNKNTSSGGFFSAHSISIRTQKKLASQMPQSFTKFFIDDTSSRLFDNVNKLVMTYTGSKKQADKLMKNLVKLNVKLAILNLNNILTEDEALMTTDLKECFHNIAELFLRLKQPNRNKLPGPKASIDTLLKSLDTGKDLTVKIISKHISEKNKNKIIQSISFFMDEAFLGKVLSEDPLYFETMNLVIEDVEELMDRGLI